MTPAAFRAALRAIPTPLDSYVAVVSGKLMQNIDGLSLLPESDEVVRICRPDKPDWFVAVSAISAITYRP